MEQIKTGHPIIDGSVLAAIFFMALSSSQIAVVLSIIGGVLYVINQTLQIYKTLTRTNDKTQPPKT